MNEFEIIKRYFERSAPKRKDIILGIGDDAAIIQPPSQQLIAITSDTLVSGIHFYADMPANDIGHKSLAVNLSDLAAMGATPYWMTLALTLPANDEAWLAEFAKGFFDLASRYHIELIGGDLTHGPLSITITALGCLPINQGLTRANAKPGDLIFVTNTLGDAAFALKHQIKSSTKLNRPEPQIEIGNKILGIASSAIDISDGLAADLGHILEQSQVGADVNVAQIPLGNNLSQCSPKEALELALTGGDDYELCFTVSPDKIALLEKALPSNRYHYTQIGFIKSDKKLYLHYPDGSAYVGAANGYKHF